MPETDPIPTEAQPSDAPEIFKEPVIMLDVHPAHHAANTWREFFTHIATIVLGLLIAVGLEQSVEWVHHRSELRETREALRVEREQNRKAFAYNTAAFRFEAQLMKNNLLVLAFLKEHPGTPEDKLPGVLNWSASYEPTVHVAWDAAQQSNVTQYMARAETVDASGLYRALLEGDAAVGDFWHAISAAELYAGGDPNLSQLSAAEVEEQIGLAQSCINALFRVGVQQENIHQNYPDFSPSPTVAELYRTFVRQRSGQDYAGLSQARALTKSRVARSEDAFQAAQKTLHAK
jgi:hypothetical protein